MYHIFISARTIAKSKAPIKPPVAFDVRTKSDAHLLERSEYRAACSFARTRCTLAEHLIQFSCPLTKGEHKQDGDTISELILFPPPLASPVLICVCFLCAKLHAGLQHLHRNWAAAGRLECAQ